MEIMFYLLVSLFGIITSNAKIYYEKDIFISNSSTYYNKPIECQLFGGDFQKDHLVNGIRLSITTETLFWIGGRIEFTKKFNPLGSKARKECGEESSGKPITVKDCANKCMDKKYFASNNKTCTCLEVKGGLKPGTFERSRNCGKRGFCTQFECNLYERDFLDEDYMCETYRYIRNREIWEFQFIKCLEKKNYGFICRNGDFKLTSESISWYEAYQRCIDYGSELLHDPEKLPKTNSSLWASLLRRPSLMWGKDLTKTVCVVARIQINGSYRLESHSCNDSLEFLCHRPDHTNYGSSDAEIMTASLGTVLGVVVVCTIVVAAINYRRISIYKDKLKKVNERLPGTEFSTYTEIEENNEELNNLGYNELVVSTSHRLAECHEIEMDKRDDAMDYQGYLVPEQHYHTILETEVHYTEACIAENNAVN